jgi:hypothetical protein
MKAKTINKTLLPSPKLKKVFILFCAGERDIEDTILGVYSSSHEAEKNLTIAENVYYPDDLGIYEIVLDEDVNF